MTTHVALLRGINVGGNNMLPMPALRQCLTGLGFGNVKTYLASGNVVLDAPDPAAEVGARLRTAIKGEFGLDIRIVVRDAGQLAAALARGPFGTLATDPSRYFLNFCDPAPDPATVADVDHAAYLPEQFALIADVLYFWMPEGIQRARLPVLLSEKRLGVTITSRNWRTVTKLLALAGG